MNADPSPDPGSKKPGMPNAIRILLAVLGAGACACALVCAFSWALTVGLKETLPPVYTMDQVDSPHDGYQRTTLTSGNTVYVSDYEEFALLSMNTQPPERIGRFLFSEENVSGVYAIPGQDPSAYVLEYDPMYQQVFRHLEHPPFDWRAAEFQKLRLMLPASPIDTTDVRIIEDVLSALKTGEPVAVSFRADGNYSQTQNIPLLLFTDQLPGLMYNVGVHVDAEGQVFLAENMISNQWFPAGSLFIEWMNP